jgi:hypothetical protein
MASNPLLAFLTGDGRDDMARRFEDIIAFDDPLIERRHDFIQWLFPLDEPSRAVPGSPVLDEATIAALKASSVAQDRLHRAAQRMLDFYRRTTAWRKCFDHNHLRITRIIKSLRMLAGDAEADAFRAGILALAGDAPIDPTAKRFWMEA